MTIIQWVGRLKGQWLKTESGNRFYVLFQCDVTLRNKFCLSTWKDGPVHHFRFLDWSRDACSVTFFYACIARRERSPHFPLFISGQPNCLCFGDNRLFNTTETRINIIEFMVQFRYFFNLQKFDNVNTCSCSFGYYSIIEI